MTKRFLAAISLLVLSVFGCDPKPVPAPVVEASAPVANLPVAVGKVAAIDFDAPAAPAVVKDAGGKAGAIQSSAARNARCTGSGALANGGTVKLYNGNKTGKNADSALATMVGADTLVASWTLQATAFTCTNGVGTLNGTPLSATATATATCSGANATSCYLALVGSNGTSVVWVLSGSLTGGGGEVVFDVNPQSGGTAQLTGLTHTEGAGSKLEIFKPFDVTYAANDNRIVWLSAS